MMSRKVRSQTLRKLSSTSADDQDAPRVTKIMIGIITPAMRRQASPRNIGTVSPQQLPFRFQGLKMKMVMHTAWIMLKIRQEVWRDFWLSVSMSKVIRIFDGPVPLVKLMPKLMNMGETKTT